MGIDETLFTPFQDDLAVETSNETEICTSPTQELLFRPKQQYKMPCRSSSFAMSIQLSTSNLQNSARQALTTVEATEALIKEGAMQTLTSTDVKQVHTPEKMTDTDGSPLKEGATETFASTDATQIHTPSL